MSVSLMAFTGEVNPLDSIATLEKYSPRLGLGTTGLGTECNQSLSKDTENFIKGYLTRKEAQAAWEAKEAAARLPKPMKPQERQAWIRAQAEKAQAIKENLRAKLVQERATREAVLRADRERAIQETRDAVEADKAQNQKRRAKQKQLQEEYEAARRMKMAEDVAREKEILVVEAAAAQQAAADKQARQKELRKAQRAHAESLQVARAEQEKKTIENERKKLNKLREEGKKMRNELLQERRDGIREAKKKREAKQEAKKIALEKEIENNGAMRTQHMAQYKKERDARKERELAEKRQVIEKVKQETDMARTQLLKQREAWAESVKQGLDVGKAPTSPMFPPLKNPLSPR